jgi:hypothetical protein
VTGHSKEICTQLAVVDGGANCLQMHTIKPWTGLVMIITFTPNLHGVKKKAGTKLNVYHKHKTL